MAMRVLRQTARWDLVWAFGLYAAASLLLYGRGLVMDPGRVAGSYGGADQSFGVWSLVHWSRVLVAGDAAFLTHAIYAPQGFDLGWASTMPGPSLLLAPITLTAGPTVAYDVIALAAPALTGLATYALCRRLSGSTAGALVAGWLTAFGSYGAGEQLNHPDLAFVALVPLGALLVVRRLDGELSRRWFVVALALIAAAQLLVFPEVAATGALAGAGALALVAALGGRERRVGVLRLLPELACAAVLAAALASPLLVAMLGHANPIASGALKPVNYSADAANLLCPTTTTQLRLGRSASCASHLTANITEQVAYIGPVVLAVIGLALVRLRRSRLAWGAGLFVALSVLAALGPVLHVSGEAVLRMPWAGLFDLPLLRFALPARFMLFAWLGLGGLVALWVAGPRRLGVVGRLALAAIAAATVLPHTTEASLWSARISVPQLFAGDAYRRVLHEHERVLVIPFGYSGPSMVWHAQTGMWFDMVGGYAAAVLPPALRRYSIVPSLLGGPMPRNPSSAMRTLLVGQHVDAVLLDPIDVRPWASVLRGAGLRPRFVGGLWLYAADERRRV
jgi:hypothetical protein